MILVGFVMMVPTSSLLTPLDTSVQSQSKQNIKYSPFALKNTFLSEASASATRGLVLTMGPVAPSLAACVMRLSPPETTMTPGTCATSKYSSLIYTR